MTNAKTTKRALGSSVLALVLCFAMLLGTTYAWFTDSVTSANNVISSGNLDIELEYWNGTEWVDVAGKSDILTNTLWEPGVTEVAYLRVANAGSLALKYQLGINIVEELEGINAAGDEFLLSDYIQFGVIEGIAVNADTKVPTTYANRDAAVAAVTDAKKISAGYTKATSMESGKELYLALVVWMPTTVGNVANHNGVNVPKIDLGINVVATQLTAEVDSFGNDYDAGAPWLGGTDTDWYTGVETEYVISTADELAGLAQLVNAGESFAGKTIKLGGNIDLNDLAWTPIGGDLSNCFSGTLDGNGYTIYNLNVESSNNAGLIGYAAYGGNVKNLTVNNATVKGNDYAGVIMGRGYTDIDNCRVENATVIVTPYAKNGVYDGGAKAGGVIGQLLEGAGNTVTNCSVNNVTVYGFRDIGGVVGMVHNSNSCSDNTATNVTIGYVVCEAITADENENAGAIYGRVQASATVSPAKDSAENQAYTSGDPIYMATDVASLKSALTTGGDIVMVSDITVTDSLVMNKSCTLDLNGNTLYMSTIDDSKISGAANITIKNGTIDISGANFSEHNGIFNIVGGAANTLTIENVDFYGDGYYSYSVFWIAKASTGINTLNLVDSKFELKNEAYSSGGFIKHPSGVLNCSSVNITNSVLDFENVTRLFLYGVYNIKDSEINFVDTTGEANGLRQGQFTIDNSKVTISGGDKGISPKFADTVIKNGSVVTISNVKGNDVIFEADFDILVDSSSTFTYTTVSGNGGGDIIAE